MQYFILDEHFQLYLSCVWCFMHMAVIITRARLAQWFLDENAQYHTIPRQFDCMQQQHFSGGKVDKAVPCRHGSKLYVLNVWAMACAWGKERTMSVKDE
jgi:hypothetical protein